jgi:GNAT superfamily N-acetyltransferase
VIRKAVPEDLPRIAALMRASMEALGAAVYGPAELPSAVRYIAVADPQLVDDGTYFVIEEGGQLVACGGWSARTKLFTGSAAQEGLAGRLDPARDAARIRAMFVHPAHARRGLGRRILDAAEDDARRAGFVRFELMATLPGVPLYAACGYREIERTTIELPDGVTLETVRMGR